MNPLAQLRQGLDDLHQIRLVLEALWIDTQTFDGTAPTYAEAASRDSYFNATSTPRPDKVAQAMREHEAETARRARRN